MKWNTVPVMTPAGESPLGLLSFLSFAFSVIAAVLAIDMYKLLRTGGFGKTWRVLITASVMLALLQVLRMAEILNFRAIEEAHLGQIVELCFVMTLAYAFYCQRQVFSNQNQEKNPASGADEEPELERDWDDQSETDSPEDDEIEGAQASALDSQESHFFGADFKPPSR